MAAITVESAMELAKHELTRDRARNKLAELKKVLILIDDKKAKLAELEKALKDIDAKPLEAFDHPHETHSSFGNAPNLMSIDGCYPRTATRMI